MPPLHPPPLLSLLFSLSSCHRSTICISLSLFISIPTTYLVYGEEPPRTTTTNKKIIIPTLIILLLLLLLVVVILMHTTVSLLWKKEQYCCKFVVWQFVFVLGMSHCTVVTGEEVTVVITYCIKKLTMVDFSVLLFVFLFELCFLFSVNCF